MNPIPKIFKPTARDASSTLPSIPKPLINCYRYPFTCADVLGSDSQAILSEFFKSSSEIKEKAAERARKAAALNESKDDEVNLEDPESAQRTNSTSEESPTSEDKENQIPTNQVENFEFLDYLFTFLDKPSVNYTAAGYFAKIVNNLYAKKPSIVSLLTKIFPLIMTFSSSLISMKPALTSLRRWLTTSPPSPLLNSWLSFLPSNLPYWPIMTMKLTMYPLKLIHPMF